MDYKKLIDFIHLICLKPVQQTQFQKLSISFPTKIAKKAIFYFTFLHMQQNIYGFCIAMKMYFSLLNDRFNFQSSSKIRGILSAFNLYFVDRWYRIRCSVLFCSLSTVLCYTNSIHRVLGIHKKRIPNPTIPKDESV